ncbi:PREDICTED: uncharacterized protein LOC109582139 [Amphimedon queenslandica]|uniref:Uncharacterized protein n=1 Tax=Amphimedon queenslandica TaxID=400682 RepID=A0AAN0J6D8_AMPQE|nr:PREDICTED: uncharacterized protein LOC109582139 [Amphimedon queenslandica]|eukprot:XP_019852317.1 PREDICTED: uncharacterized protein LOC109582139 [Amphimedon queenslandica]
MAIVQYHALVTLECTGEAPGNIRVVLQCNGTGVVYDIIYLVEYARQPINITGSVPVLQYQQCNISIVFSNEAGSSEPFILAFDTTLSSYINSSVPVVPTLSSTLIITNMLFGVLASLITLIAVTLLLFMIYLKRRKIKSRGDYKVSQEQSTNPSVPQEVSNELVRHVFSAGPMPSKDMKDNNIALQPMVIIC